MRRLWPWATSRHIPPLLIIMVCLPRIRGSIHSAPSSTPKSALQDDPCKEFRSGGMSGLNEFASPGFPHKYPSNTDCVRVIYAPPSYDILLAFKNVFQIETSYEDAVDSEASQSAVSSLSNCPNDYLEVRDGRYSFSPLIGQFCGMKSPTTEIRSRSGFMWLHFHSDNLLEYRGFMAEFEFVRGPIYGHGLQRPLDCHFSFAMPLDGHIDISSMYQFYRDNQNSTGSIDCVWQVQVPKWLSVAIFAEEFHLYSPNQCHTNFLEIYSGVTANVPLKRYCGVTANHVYSNQPTVFIRVFAASQKALFGTKLRLLFSTYVALKNCSSHGLFSCGDDICIPQELVCSGRPNCLYGRDENNCGNNENVKSVVFSGYGILIILVVLILLIVVGLFFWYRPCRTHEAKVDAYLKELCNQPPPGLNQDKRPRSIHRRVNSHLTDFSLTPESSPSRSESITLAELTHHSHCSTTVPKPLPPNGNIASRPSSASSDRRHTDSNFIPPLSGVPRVLQNRRLHSLQTDLRMRPPSEVVIEVAEDVDENGNAETSFYDSSRTVVL